MASTFDRHQQLALSFPETARVDVEAWGGEPTFRVAGKNFIFTSTEARSITVKLGPEEAAAVVATTPGATPTGYGLGRHGWVTIPIPPRPTASQWREVTEWVTTSYDLVAPKRLRRARTEHA